MTPAACLRWREGTSHLRVDRASIDPARHAVEVLPDAEAKVFVERHHYSRSYPAARLAVGLYRTRAWFTPELVGVAVFSVPMNQRVIPAYSGLAPSSGVELGRFVLLDMVERNAETWFLARAFERLTAAKPDVQAVISYSDPLPRQAPDGQLLMPGHVGTIYQAANARFVGRGKGEWSWMAPDGSLISRRTRSKVRNDEVGAAYAYRQLRRWGAPERRLDEAGPAYLDRALAEGPFRRFRHPGNLAYLFTVGAPRVQRRVRRGASPALPYPKPGLLQPCSACGAAAGWDCGTACPAMGGAA